jgi:hypothetical protein
MELDDIKKFEAANENISINLFGLAEDNVTLIGPYYLTKQERPCHANLLLIMDGEKAHYTWIKNLSRVVSNQLSSYGHQVFICNACLLPFSSEASLISHKDRKDCFRTVINIPKKEENILKFSDWKKCHRLHFCIFADTEAFVRKIEYCTPNGETSSTTNTHIHEASAAGYKIVCNSPEIENFEYKDFFGENCIRNFIKSLVKDCRHIAEKYLTVDNPMEDISDEQLRAIREENNNQCWLCKGDLGPYEEKGELKEEGPKREKVVHHHDHLTGKFIGHTHNSCNLKLQKPDFLNVVFHNLNYDCSLIIRELMKIEGAVSVTPLNKEKYISIYKTIALSNGSNFRIRFIDSFRFLPSSLENLASTLKIQDFIELRKQIIFDYDTDQNFSLLARKGHYPYTYMDSAEKFQETALPDISQFYSEISDCSKTQEEYEHAQNVWETFKIKNLKEYTQLYLKTDVLILADVFQNFRDICYRRYGLEPLWYITLAGLSWSCMLKMTGAEIELLTDDSMLALFQGNIRGGLSQVCKKVATANNEYLNEGYDPKKEKSYITYLDVNNQYGAALSEKLPIRNFKWIEENLEDWTKKKICALSDEAPIGYVFEVDLDYPESLHDFHNDFPFAIENIEPPTKTDKKSCKKLIPNLMHKRKYVCHYRILKQCLENGLVLGKVHRLLQFEQESFIRPYIELNTKYRQAAQSDFERDFYKLLNNVIFGKSMENRVFSILTNFKISKSLC